MGEIKVLGVKFSAFSLRVELALKLKGVDYEFVEEDLINKSEQLLKYNPIYKKIPVFIHQEKHLVESLVILEYVDETWKSGYPIMPKDPYERAQARFWASFIDEKLINTVKIVMRGNEDEKEKAREEVKELLKIFENEVKGKKYLGGNKIGYLDLVAIVVALWVPVIFEAMDDDILTRDKFLGLWAWIDHLLGCDIVKENIPDKEKLLAFYRAHFPATPGNHGPK